MSTTQNKLRGLKQKELRALATCAWCRKKIGQKQIPILWRVKMEMHYLDLGALQRQHGLELMCGGNAMIAAAMGPDEDLTQCVESIETMICQDCMLRQVIPAVVVEFARKPADTQP